MNKNRKVLSFLQESTVGVLATFEKETCRIKQRIMYYSIDKKYNIYFMSMRDSPKKSQILSNPEASFIVFGIEKPYDSTWEIEIEGSIRIVDQLKKQEDILKTLKNRNPFAGVAFESDIMNQFDFFHLIPGIVKYSVYGELLKGNPPYIIRI